MGGGVATDSGARTTSGTSSRTHYRPQLDGLRALAVYLVLAYHSGIHAFSGGFIGVDVFFVLSGYLVTQLLLRDFRSAGRIDFRRFYSRRFRRLLPAAFVTLVVTAAVYTAVAAPADAANARGGFRAAFLYFANWHFISQSNDYFAANVNSNPVLHFWSLAVEEQFYVMWPLLLSGIYLVAGRVRDRQWKVTRLIIAAGFVVSLGAALHLSTVNVNRAYYGTDTRAYELLAGALLALTPRALRVAGQRRRAVQVLAPVVLAALVLVASSVIHLGQIQRGVAATLATCGLIVAIEVSTAGWVTRLLSTPTAGYLGRVSYGTYLWHWPVIVIATLRFHPNPVSLFALTCLVGTALASLSYEILEQRVRLSSLLDHQRSAVIAVGLTISIVGGLVIVPAIFRQGRRAGATSAVSAGVTVGGLLVPSGLHLDEIATASYGIPDCYHLPVSECIVAKGSGLRLLVMGDSHAASFSPAFREVARKDGFTVAIATTPNCPWPRGVVEAPGDAPTDLPRTCRSHQDDWYSRVVPQFDPDVIVLVHRTMDDAVTPAFVRLPDNRRLVANTPDAEQALQTVVRQSIDQLRKRGRKIVVLEPIPISSPKVNPFTCLSQARYLDACRYVARANPTRLERYYRALANGKDIFTLDLDRVVCPYLPICDPIVDGVVVKRDPQHITPAFSRHMGDPIQSLLAKDAGIGRGQ
jgi:peptidoglycan/LPS O-acetylase OafA/YrhL